MKTQLNPNNKMSPHRGNRKLATWLPVLLTVLHGSTSLSSAQSFDLTFNGFAGWGQSVGGGGQNDISQHLTGATGPVSFGATAPMNGSLTLGGSVMPGILHASASGTATGNVVAGFGGDWSTVYGRTTANASEGLTLSIPGVASGQLATVQFSYYLPGDMTFAHTGRAYDQGWMYFVVKHAGGSPALIPLSGEQPYRDQEHLPLTIPPDVFVDTLPGGRIVTYEHMVHVGQPFGLVQQLDVIGTASGDSVFGSASFSVDFAAYWNGVSSVTVGGVPVSGYSLVNSDGVDFTNSFAPVPEPEHYAALAGLGLLGFAFWRRATKRA